MIFSFEVKSSIRRVFCWCVGTSAKTKFITYRLYNVLICINHMINVFESHEFNRDVMKEEDSTISSMPIALEVASSSI